MKLDQAPGSGSKLFKKSAKHTVWMLIALATGLTFVGYFYPIRELIADIFTLQANGWAYFWVAFFTVATYLNAGWMREQVCLYMCPYARFQSVMFDPDTRVVSYDPTGASLVAGVRKVWIRPRLAWVTALTAVSVSRSAPPASTFAMAFNMSALAARCASTPATRSWIRWTTREA
ncbi:hypothetical protein AU14_00350 [Marinobacter similis]|uniref:4Fe-4S ferredoxin-type domain-containing protein n=1 Tax=Marinobacter similis TaxID=1420916 RepID=W5YLJ6_9GAMM|nr:hypothetical protein AU14_00350 [Marinobacter similis]